MRAAVVLAWALALCGLVGPALARAKHRRPVGTCNAHRAHVAKKPSKALIYAKHTGTDEYSGGRLTTYYACLRPRGNSRAVGQRAAGGDEYPGNEAMSDLSVAGTYVADVSSRGYASAAACSEYDGDDPVCSQQITFWIEVVEARTRRALHIDAPGGADALALSSAGGARLVGPDFELHQRDA